MGVVHFYVVTDINSMALGKSRCNFKNQIFILDSLISIFISSYHNALGWILQDHTDDKSTLVQVMAWCRQATSHFLSQCWPSFMSSYGITRPQWVKGLSCRLWWMREWRNLLTSTHVGHRLCHVGSCEWWVTKIWVQCGSATDFQELTGHKLTRVDCTASQDYIIQQS